MQSVGRARINIKLSVGDYFIDDQGRILILLQMIEIQEPSLRQQVWSTMVTIHVLMMQDGRDSLTLQEMALKITDWQSLQTTAPSKLLVQLKNIYKMMNANVKTLSTSLTDWELAFASVGGYAIAWDDDQATYSGGQDYSGILWNDGTTYTSGYAYYGGSKPLHSHQQIITSHQQTGGFFPRCFRLLIV